MPIKNGAWFSHGQIYPINYFLDNNNGLRNEVTDHSASIKEDFDVQPNTLLNRSEPDMQCKVQTEDDLKLKPEIHSAAKESLRPRRGRKQNENQSQNTVENSNRYDRFSVNLPGNCIVGDFDWRTILIMMLFKLIINAGKIMGLISYKRMKKVLM